MSCALPLSEPLSPPGSSTLLGKRRSFFGANGVAPSPSKPACTKLPAKSSLYREVPRQPCAPASPSAASGEPDDAAAAIAAPPLVDTTKFYLAAPAGGAGVRVIEYQLLRPLMLLRRPPALAALAPPSEEEVRGLECDGWRDEDGEGGATVTLLLPADAADAQAPGDSAAFSSLLRLVDDDKQAGLTQASLPDLFLRLSMRSGGGVGGTR